ncbi:hypothetical protein [Rhodopirellula bahusiensis]|uniref:Uncharacterized protein n=1 Tax=Rhodopirellula bahusiensis TaxID=2014065 RepID=A0A2G1W5R7_9BACT|nr:hypothetical protein [Rhodopirellula bahusiensis]PHQ34366.1 hypothetical protein CEE69_15220 [Rhodopirellula bahusiensis]
MNPTTESVVLLWSVPCFDRLQDNPFPVYNRTFKLDWSELSEEATREILEILDAEKPMRPSPSGFDTAVISFERSKREPDNRMLKYRKHFKEVDERQLEESFNNDLETIRRFTFVNLNREYFETEDGEEITHYDMIRHVSGQDKPVIVGDVECMRRIGVIPAKNDCGWSSKKANTVAQFLDVVVRIANSRWNSSGHSITFEIPRDGDSSKYPSSESRKLLAAAFPDDEETMSVLSYFRQLHAGDNLLVRACQCYTETVSDERKAFWVNERRSTFEKIVDSPPRPFNTIHNRRKILQMFMYGGGLLHADSRHGDEKKLNEFLEANGPTHSIAIFNSCLHDFLRIAASVHNVIKPDFYHWINEQGLDRPTRTNIREMFTRLED